MEYQVKIEAFEGPLDLLLHLINRLEIDIYDIPVAKITEQYLLYVHTMRELELDVASEYLVMAATLLSIKSRMLLPKQEEELFDEEFLEEEEDPREELIEKLIEYRKYKSAAQKFEGARGRAAKSIREAAERFKRLCQGNQTQRAKAVRHRLRHARGVSKGVKP